MADRDKLPVHSLLSDTVVAFEARDHLSPDTRAAVAHAAVTLVDEVLDDLGQLGQLRNTDRVDWDALSTTTWLPDKWKLATTKPFFQDWAVALISVAHGLAQIGWDGPACVGEELALHAICEYARTLPDLFDLDSEQLEQDIDLLTEMAFQDTDFEFLFEPAADGIDESSEIGRASCRER